MQQLGASSTSLSHKSHPLSYQSKPIVTFCMKFVKVNADRKERKGAVIQPLVVDNVICYNNYSEAYMAPEWTPAQFPI